MALERKDRVRETTTTTGTGTVNLDGAVTGFRTFVSCVTSGATVRYFIETADLTEWEVGEGIFTDATPDTLSRVTVYASSNAGSLVNFSAGDKIVALSLVAEDVPDGSSIVSNEVPTGLINSSNTVYTTAYNFVTGKTQVYLNRTRLKLDEDYTETAANQITLTVAPTTGDDLWIDYFVRSTSVNFGATYITYNETPTGTINGTTTAFDTANSYIAGSLQVFLNGQLQTLTTDYTETDANTFTFVTAPMTGDILRVTYQRLSTPAGNADTLDNANLSTDGTLATNSDGLIPTEKAVKTYANTKLATSAKATGAEINTGTDDAKYVTPKAIKDSYLNIPYKFSVYRNAAQNTGNGDFAKIGFDTEVYDIGNNFDAVTNNRFVAPVDGYYHFDAGAIINATVTRGVLSLYVNNAEAVRGNDIGASMAQMCLGVSADLYLAANNYVEVFVLGNAAIALRVGAAYSTRFSGHLISVA